MEVKVPENGTATYTVVLDAVPTGRVIITVAKQDGGDADLTASPASLTFTTGNWSTPQTVTVRAADDDDLSNGQGDHHPQHRLVRLRPCEWRL